MSQLGGGPQPRAMINALGQPTRCSGRCQEMIAYKVHQ